MDFTNTSISIEKCSECHRFLDRATRDCCPFCEGKGEYCVLNVECSWLDLGNLMELVHRKELKPDIPEKNRRSFMWIMEKIGQKHEEGALREKVRIPLIFEDLHPGVDETIYAYLDAADTIPLDEVKAEINDMARKRRDKGVIV